MGAQPRGARPRLPEPRDGQRGRPALRDAGGAGLGQLAVAGLLRVLLDHTAGHPARRPRDLARPAPLGQPGAHDLLLPGGGPRGQARARPGRAARAAPAGHSDDRRARRDGGPGRDLPRVQRGRRRGARVGSRDVDRHRVRPGRPGDRRAAGAHPPARVPAQPRRGRRPRGAGRHRRGLHGPPLAGGARGGGGAVRRRGRAALHPVRVASPGGGGARRRAVGGAAEVGHRSDRLRSGRRARHDRLLAGARRPRARGRADAVVP